MLNLIKTNTDTIDQGLLPDLNRNFIQLNCLTGILILRQDYQQMNTDEWQVSKSSKKLSYRNVYLFYEKKEKMVSCDLISLECLKKSLASISCVTFFNTYTVGSTHMKINLSAILLKTFISEFINFIWTIWRKFCVSSIQKTITLENNWNMKFTLTKSCLL